VAGHRSPCTFSHTFGAQIAIFFPDGADGAIPALQFCLSGESGDVHARQIPED